MCRSWPREVYHPPVRRPSGQRRAADVQATRQAPGDGAEALSYLRREEQYANSTNPDVILLDLNLPKKDGREVLAEIKKDSELKTIPVVVLTTSRARPASFTTSQPIPSQLSAHLQSLRSPSSLSTSNTSPFREPGTRAGASRSGGAVVGPHHRVVPDVSGRRGSRRSDRAHRYMRSVRSRLGGCRGR